MKKNELFPKRNHSVKTLYQSSSLLLLHQFGFLIYLPNAYIGDLFVVRFIQK